MSSRLRAAIGVIRVHAGWGLSANVIEELAGGDPAGSLAALTALVGRAELIGTTGYLNTAICELDHIVAAFERLAGRSDLRTLMVGERLARLRFENGDDDHAIEDFEQLIQDRCSEPKGTHRWPAPNACHGIRCWRTVNCSPIPSRAHSAMRSSTVVIRPSTAIVLSNTWFA
jgi:hypothetical protein